MKSHRASRAFSSIDIPNEFHDIPNRKDGVSMTFLRKATIDDYEQILCLKRQVHSLHVTACPEFYKEIDTPLSKEEFENDLGSDHIDIYVLSEGDKVLGYAFINKMTVANHPFIVDQTMFFIEDFCIDEKYRGKGYGKELFTRLETREGQRV
jgi:ribosomal protein S18 acetylase RimI-like enzyme